uniref:Heparan-sulfate 6-O-sulfotransferase n=1 Tax=Globodera pallida TaxID=36090 RepID=A0A183BPM4_GLOPA
MSEFAFGNSIGNAYKHSTAVAAHYQQTILSFAHITQNPDNNRFKVEGGQDVLVFLHIQKTAGTSFERFLVRHLNVTHQCKCIFGEKRKMKCQCRRPIGRIWLFSRYSTGWACNLHADYTELIVSGCVNNKLDVREGKRYKRRLFLTTFLRDPIDRFVSEYTHVSERGATWARALHFCGGRLPTPEELPLCFDPDVGWGGVSLDEFLACPYNLAFNRQTRMLSDLSLVNCYNSSAMDAIVRDRIILESAKFNLRQFAFFGLKERMAESQFLFEKTLGLT